MGKEVEIKVSRLSPEILENQHRRTWPEDKRVGTERSKFRKDVTSVPLKVTSRYYYLGFVDRTMDFGGKRTGWRETIGKNWAWIKILLFQFLRGIYGVCEQKIRKRKGEMNLKGRVERSGKIMGVPDLLVDEEIPRKDWVINPIFGEKRRFCPGSY